MLAQLAVCLSLLYFSAQDPAAAAESAAAQTITAPPPAYRYVSASTVPFAETGRLLAPAGDAKARWLIATFAVVGLLAAVAGYVSWANTRLREAKRRLEQEVSDRVRAERALRRREHTLRILHEISALHELPFSDRIQALLRFGCRQFGLPVGILLHAQGQHCEVQEVVDPDGRIARGAVMPLSHTFCCNTLQAVEPLTIEHAGGSAWRTHPAYAEGGLNAYIGIRVEVNAAVYGTLNFSSAEPRLAPFTAGDKDILRSMAQWVGSEIERHQTEAQMRKLSVALEQTADAVAIVGRDGAVEYVNPAFEQITGYRRDEMLGRSPALLCSGRHDAEFYRGLWETVLRGEVFSATLVNRRKDGSLYFEEKSITPIKDAAGEVTCFVSTGRDVSRRMLAEEQARHHQAQAAHVSRVSAMGEMATALAHELNQPLAVIANYAQGALRRLDAGRMPVEELRGALEQIAAQAGLSAEIIRRMRGFLRKGDQRRSATDINRIVREAVDLASIEARRKQVAIVLDLAPELPPVLADTLQIEQVMLNLLHNAFDAIHHAQRKHREVAIHTTHNGGRRVEVAVTDSGPGVSAEVSERLFDAFYTTKPDGMGMGLSISRSIIESHGDVLRVTTGPGGGAAFRFGLPVAALRAEL